MQGNYNKLKEASKLFCCRSTRSKIYCLCGCWGREAALWLCNTSLLV